MTDLIPVTKKGSKTFRGLADQATIDRSNGKLIKLDMQKYAADVSKQAEAKASEEVKKAEAKASEEAAKPFEPVKPADIKRSPSKGA